MSFKGLSEDEALLWAPAGLKLLEDLAADPDGLEALLADAGREVRELSLAAAVLVDEAKVKFLLSKMKPGVRSVVRSFIPKVQPAPRPQNTSPTQGESRNSAREDLRCRLEAPGPGGAMVVRPSVENASVILAEDPEWVDRIRLDTFKRQEMLGAGSLQDVDHINLVRWLDRNYGTEWPIEKVRYAVTSVAHMNQYNPVQDYLTNLPEWDGVSRCERLLFDYFPCQAEGVDVELLQAYGRCFMISLVARGLKPGEKVDTVLSLQGGQGLGKSTGLRLLMQDEGWFSDDELNFGDVVRLQMHVRGKWLIEIGDFSSVKKADVDAVKTMITQKYSQFTPKYGRSEVVEPRTCVFVATANAPQFLLDDGRRWWVAAVVSKVLWDLIVQDRDQLFAEASTRHAAGEQWHLPDELVGRQKADVSQYTIKDPMVYKIEEWTGSMRDSPGSKYSLQELWQKINCWDPVAKNYDGNAPEMRMADSKTFAAHLRVAGWAQKRESFGIRWHPPK